MTVWTQLVPVTVWTQVVPIGGYRATVFKDLNQWITDHYDVRLYVGTKIVRQESFTLFEVAQAYCDWLDRGITLAGNNSTETGTP